MFSNSDKDNIVKLVEHFRKYGIIKKSIISFNDVEEASDIIDSANLDAKYEKDLNPDFYDKDLDEHFSKKVVERENFMIEYHDE